MLTSYQEIVHRMGSSAEFIDTGRGKTFPVACGKWSHCGVSVSKETTYNVKYGMSSSFEVKYPIVNYSSQWKFACFDSVTFLFCCVY